MSVVIRLARAGTKKRPVYHVVVADSRFPRDGRFIERLGHFNPLLAKDNEARLKLDMDKTKAWLAKGAQPSDRVSRFLTPAASRKRITRSDGCAPLASQALTLSMSSFSRVSLSFGSSGLKWPRRSMKRPSRGKRESAATT